MAVAGDAAATMTPPLSPEERWALACALLDPLCACAGVVRELTDEVIQAINIGIPVEALCLYPIVDRFEWEDPTHWHNSGLWDFAPDAAGNFIRVINEPYAEEFRRSRARLPVPALR